MASVKSGKRGACGFDGCTEIGTEDVMGVKLCPIHATPAKLHAGRIDDPDPVEIDNDDDDSPIVETPQLRRLRDFAIGTFAGSSIVSRYLRQGQLTLDHVLASAASADFKKTDSLKDAQRYLMRNGIPKTDARPDLWVGAYLALTMLAETDSIDAIVKYMTNDRGHVTPWGVLRRFDSLINWDSEGCPSWKDRVIDDGNVSHSPKSLAQAVISERWSAERLGDFLKADSLRRTAVEDASRTEQARREDRNKKIRSGIKGALKKFGLDKLTPEQLESLLREAGVLPERVVRTDAA